MTDKAHPNLVNGKPVTPENIAGILVNGYSGTVGVMPNRAEQPASPTQTSPTSSPSSRV